MPHFLYIKKRYLQPPTKRAESTLPEQSVVQEDVLVSTNVPTNPLADLPGLRWNQYSLPPSPINLKRAKRWLNSNKKRALRRTSKLKVGKCPHKRWSAEWVIIREVGRVNDDEMSMEEVHHRLCFLKTLQLINSDPFRGRMNDTILFICRGSYQSKGSAKLDRWGHKTRMRPSLEAISTTFCKPLHSVSVELEKKRIVRAKVILNKG